MILVVVASFLTCDVNATWITIDNIIYDVAGDTAIVYSGKSCSGAVVIPGSITCNGENYRVTTIGELAFDGCSWLEKVYCKAKTPTNNIGAYSFNLGWRDITLYVPIGSKDAYASANQWRFFNPIIEMDFSIKGDIDGDESVGVSDVTALISMILAQ